MDECMGFPTSSPRGSKVTHLGQYYIPTRLSLGKYSCFRQALECVACSGIELCVLGVAMLIPTGGLNYRNLLSPFCRDHINYICNDPISK